MAGPWGMSVGWGGLQKSLPSVDFREAQAKWGSQQWAGRGPRQEPP